MVAIYRLFGIHHSEIDVTGGIELKAKRGTEVASFGIEVMLINGESPSDYLMLVSGDKLESLK